MLISFTVHHFFVFIADGGGLCRLTPPRSAFVAVVRGLRWGASSVFMYPVVQVTSVYLGRYQKIAGSRERSSSKGAISAHSPLFDAIQEQDYP